MAKENTEINLPCVVCGEPVPLTKDPLRICAQCGYIDPS